MSIDTTDCIRRCIFKPYRRGMGPIFTLALYSCDRVDSRPQTPIGYRLHMSEDGVTTVLFEGDDFGCSPMDTIDGDNCVNSLMGFLTLGDGDTDAEYFDSYTPPQLAYRDDHAAALGMEVYQRFGEEA